MYSVDLETFHGPLDLLLHLVKQHEVDVRDIPIAKITAQFLEYLELMRYLDVELAGEFIVMASTLMEIKSRLVLPQERDESEEADAETEELGDPRRELIRQLVEYRKYKDAAGNLDMLRRQHHGRMSRLPVPQEKPVSEAPVPVRPVELWDLVSAFARLTREAEALKPVSIVVDDTPQHIYQERIVERLAREGRVAFGDLIERPITRARLIGLFLAMLELIKRRALWLEQSDSFDQIWLVPPPGEVAPDSSGETGS